MAFGLRPRLRAHRCGFAANRVTADLRRNFACLAAIIYDNCLLFQQIAPLPTNLLQAKSLREPYIPQKCFHFWGPRLFNRWVLTDSQPTFNTKIKNQPQGLISYFGAGRRT